MSKQQAAPKRPATQQYLDISEIRDNVVVLKDGTVRAVILVSSINFALKSNDEQQAVIQGYMQFLNSLEYPIQISIQSRKVNISEYIQRLRDQQSKVENELLRNQMDDYVEFIERLVEGGEIMSKRFYVVVPFDPLQSDRKGFFARFREVLAPAAHIKLNDNQFSDRTHDLEQRVSQILGGLNSMGLRGVRLDTEGLIELYYNAYNPLLAEVQPLKNVDDVQIETSYGF